MKLITRTIGFYDYHKTNPVMAKWKRHFEAKARIVDLEHMCTEELPEIVFVHPPYDHEGCLGRIRKKIEDNPKTVFYLGILTFNDKVMEYIVEQIGEHPNLKYLDKFDRIGNANESFFDLRDSL